MHHFSRLLAVTTATLAVFFVFSGQALASLGQPQNDVDGDHWNTELEAELGSSPFSPTSTPEDQAARALSPQCFNGLDDDRDGVTDSADPGCTPPPVSSVTFPSAGKVAFKARLQTKGLLVNLGGGKTCVSDFDGQGTVVDSNSDPVDVGGGLRQMENHVVAMQVVGMSTIVPGGNACPFPPGFQSGVTVVGDPTQPSTGQIDDTNSDPGTDFPATGDANFGTFATTAVGPLHIPGEPTHNANISSIPAYSSAPDQSDCYKNDDETIILCPLAPDTSAPAAPSGENDYSVYKVRGPDFIRQSATFENFLGSHPVTLIKPEQFGSPAVLTPPGDPVADPDSYLSCYKSKVPFPTGGANILTVDKYGYHTTGMKKFRDLCVSAQKPPSAAPTGANDYACYGAKRVSPFSTQTMSVQDDFGTTPAVNAYRPYWVCSPASINGAPIPDDSLWLNCYKAKTTTAFSPSTFDVNDVFGSLSGVTTKKLFQTCVPAHRVTA